jgi:hypothetical protein
MAGNLQGAAQLQSRLKAMRLAFKPMGKDWATETAAQSNRTAPRGATGRLARSHKVKSATQRGAKVVAIFYGKFVNRGTAPHTIKAKNAPALIFNVGGRTIFARAVKHRGSRGTRYVDKAAQKALKEHVSTDALIDAWNRAA